MSSVRTHLLALSALFGLLLATLVVTGPPATAAGPHGSLTKAQYERRVMSQSNLQRERRDLRSLKAMRCLDRKAQAHARRLARIGRLEHQDLGVVLRDCRRSAVGENLASGHGLRPARAVRLWMKSPGHRANLLRPVYRQAGVGTAADKSGRLYVVVVYGAP